MVHAALALEDDSPDAAHETREWLTHVVRFDSRGSGRPERMSRPSRPRCRSTRWVIKRPLRLIEPQKRPSALATPSASSRLPRCGPSEARIVPDRNAAIVGARADAWRWLRSWRGGRPWLWTPDSPASGDSRRLARDRLDQHDRPQAEFRSGDEALRRFASIGAGAHDRFGGRGSPGGRAQGRRISPATVSGSRSEAAATPARYASLSRRAGVRVR